MIVSNFSALSSNLNQYGLLYKPRLQRNNRDSKVRYPGKRVLRRGPSPHHKTLLLPRMAAGYAIGVVKPELLNAGKWWVMIGFGFGGLFIAIEELIKGFSLRSFSATTVGLMLGWLMAWVVDQSGLFQFAEEAQAWMIRLGLFLGFGYIGMILALRSNKEEFTLIVPFVRFRPQNEPSNVYLLDTSAIIDGRIAPLMETRFLEGVMVIPDLF